MRIAVLTNQTGDTVLNRLDPHAREQSRVTCEAVVEALTSLGHETITVEMGPSFLLDLHNAAPDAIFNIATGYRSKRDQPTIVAAIELTGIPFTGSSFLSHVMGIHKHLAKFIMEMSGVPTPKYCVVDAKRKIPSFEELGKLRTPVIVKPGAEGSSLGISRESVTSDLMKVPKLVAILLERFGPPVLIEEYIAGREFTVGLLGYPDPQVMPIQEVIFKEESMYTYSVKSKDSATFVCPAHISDDLASRLQSIATRVFEALDCRDLARVDIRLSEEGRPYVLEVNTLPGLMPGFSDFPRIAEIAGLDYKTMVERILDGAIRRRRSEGMVL
ncbi:MAG: D-alanine--D-alanine ligase family protein [Bacillota bacterium]